MNASNNSLGEMLEQLRDLDDDMIVEEFDPAALLGDIKDKVDAIKWKMDDWEYKANMIIEQYITPLQKKVNSLLGKKDRLKAYVTSEMKRLEVEKIPGHMFRIQLQKSNPSLEIRVPADAHMYLNYSDMVIQRTIYDWDKEKIRKYIDEGETFTFAELKQNKHIRFYALGVKK